MSRQTFDHETTSALGDAHKAVASIDPDDFTETTVRSDSLSDIRSTHESSYARQYTLQSPSDDDDDSSSPCSSTSSFDEAGEAGSLSHNVYPTPFVPDHPGHDDPLQRLSARRRTGYDSLSFLNTIESASEDDFSVDDDVSEGGFAEDEQRSEDEEDLAALCSSDS